MILKSKKFWFKNTCSSLQVTGYRAPGPGTPTHRGKRWNLQPRFIGAGSVTLIACVLLSIALLTTGCYSFKDIGQIPKEVKTFRVTYIENKARYINPQLSPQLSDRLRQKIMGQTRLAGVQTEDAHYDIGGQVTGYTFSTTGISQQQAATQRLTVTIHINFKNNLDPSKNFEADVSRNFDYSASLTITQAEQQLNETIIKQMVDEIFNRIFSNW